MYKKDCASGRCLSMVAVLMCHVNQHHSRLHKMTSTWQFKSGLTLSRVSSSSSFCRSARSRLSSAARSPSTTCASSFLPRALFLHFFSLRFLALRAQHAPWSRRHCLLSVNDVFPPSLRLLSSLPLPPLLLLTPGVLWCALFCNCFLAFLGRASDIVLDLASSISVAPDFPALVRRPDPSRSTQSELATFHPSAPLSPCR